ncbi:flagellar export chaperone FlgN [Pseudomonas aeruginosa]|nr:flagellar export chaperone FlgN [Pseudomonas aeruginosa]
MERNGRARAKSSAEAGVSLDHEGLARYAASARMAPSCASARRRTGRTAGGRCQQANLRNGQIIRANQASTGSLLNILRGQDAPSLYDGRGTS